MQQTKMLDQITGIEGIIAKYRNIGFNSAAKFLASKATNSKQTAVLYSSPIKYLNLFIEKNYNGYNIETILPELKREEIDVYELLSSFVQYLQNETANHEDLSPRSIAVYIAAARSYFNANKIPILPDHFKHQVTMPSIYHEGEEPINANDIKNILQHTDNRRLKTYLLVLASGGMRATEALAIRECDIDFSGINFADPNDTANPATIKIRAKYSKTKRERRVFISNEAARYLHDWIEWIYRDKTPERGPNTHQPLRNRQRTKDDLIFASHANQKNRSDGHPRGLYGRLLWDFQRVLNRAHLSSRKENGVYKRRKVTLHSFRRFVKTTIADQTNSDYSEYLLGHVVSPYYRNKPEELKRIYKEKCMKYLTFLDYPTLEATGRSYEAKLKEAEKENELLKGRVQHLEVTIDDLQNRRTHEIGGTTHEQEKTINERDKRIAELEQKVELLIQQMSKQK
jgi:integrase